MTLKFSCISPSNLVTGNCHCKKKQTKKKQYDWTKDLSDDRCPNLIGIQNKTKKNYGLGNMWKLTEKWKFVEVDSFTHHYRQAWNSLKDLHLPKILALEIEYKIETYQTIMSKNTEIFFPLYLFFFFSCFFYLFLLGHFFCLTLFFLNFFLQFTFDFFSLVRF